MPTEPPAARTPKTDVNVRTITQKRAVDPVLKSMDSVNSRQVQDPFTSLYAGGVACPLRVIEPTVPLDQLAKLPLENGTLAACIDAMRTNIESFGYTLEYIGPEDKKDSKEAANERQWIMDILDRCNPDESFTQVREKVRVDFETFGHAYLEVGRDDDGNPAFIYHVPAQTMRVTTAEEEERQIEVFLRRNGKVAKSKAWKRFRRFVQLRHNRAKAVYFKEFGDDRFISSVDGNENGNVSDAQEATEIVWLSRYTPGYVYGLPRYIAQVAAILGSKESELMNLNFFKDNGIPALAVLVAGGMLSDEAYDKVRDMFERKKGRDQAHRVVVLEARATEEDQPLDGSSPPVPRLDIKPLVQERQGDALFQNYLKNNSDQIRMAFKLPPLLIGLAEEYTRATADASLNMAEAQVFGPERAMMDFVVNDKLLVRDSVPPSYWRYRSNPPKMSSADEKMNALAKLNKAGGLTPNTARHMLNELFGMRLPLVKEAWGDLPFDFTMEMVRSQRISPDTGMPENENLPIDQNPNQQEPNFDTSPKRRIRIRPDSNADKK